MCNSAATFISTPCTASVVNVLLCMQLYRRHWHLSTLHFKHLRCTYECESIYLCINTIVCTYILRSQKRDIVAPHFFCPHGKLHTVSCLKCSRVDTMRISRAFETFLQCNTSGYPGQVKSCLLSLDSFVNRLRLVYTIMKCLLQPFVERKMK